MTFSNPECKLCPLYKTAQTVCIPGRGSRSPRIVIVGEAPGAEEDRLGKPFVGGSGKLLEKTLYEEGVTDYWITNTVRCRPPQNRTPGKDEIAACLPYLEKELSELKPEYVVTLGATAMKSVLGKAKITQEHGKVFEKNGRKIIPIYHPAYCLRDPSKLPAFKQDWRGVSRLLSGEKQTETSQLQWDLVTEKTLLRMLRRFEEAEEFSIDLETSGLFPWDRRGFIRCVNIGIPGKTYVIPFNLPFSPFGIPKQRWILNRLLDLAEGKWCITQNGKFDNHWIWVETGRRFHINFDTMLAHHILDENNLHDLEVISREELGEESYDIPLAEKNGEKPWELFEQGKLDECQAVLNRVYKYAAKDGDNTLRAGQSLRKKIEADPTQKRLFYRLVMPGARAMGDIETRGLTLDLKRFAEVEKDTVEKLALVKKKLDDSARLTVRKGVSRKVNWNSPAQIGKLLYENLKLPVLVKTDKGAPSTGEAAILALQGRHPVVDNLTEYRELEKFRSTYLDGWKPFMVEDRIYFSYKIHGTVCFTADTLINTNRGVLTFKDIQPGDLVLTHKARWRPVNSKVENGFKKVYRTTLEDNRVLSTTGNHRYLTIGGKWVRADKLTRGSPVIVYGEPERWKPIRGWEDHYAISSWGRVQNIRTSMIRKLRYRDSKGHQSVSLVRGDGKRSSGNLKDFKVARLVATHFLENPRDLPEVCHIDGKAWNDNSSNLYWGTRKDNARDSMVHGTNRKTRDAQAKLDWDKVEMIRKWKSQGLTNERIAGKLSVSRKLVEGVLKGERWKPEVEYSPNPSLVFSVQAVRSIEIFEAETFGLIIDEDHSHITNGIVTHNTGRYSSRLHQVPRDGRIRNLAIAPKGWVFVQADVSQAELRVAAVASQDQELMRCFKENIDVHWRTLLYMVSIGAAPNYIEPAIETAQKLEKRKKAPNLTEALEILIRQGHDAAIGIWKGWKEARKKAKAVNFGFLYGMYEKKFIETAKLKYQFEPTFEEAHEMREGYFRLYRGLPTWHDRQKRFVKLDGQVKSLSGRIRHLPTIYSSDKMVRMEAERQAINSPIQGFIGDYKVMALIEIHEKLDPKKLMIVGEHHDAILMIAKENCLEETLPVVHRIMKSPSLLKTFKVDLPIPMDSEIEVGAWGAGKVWSPK